jgi:hypothetical protein
MSTRSARRRGGHRVHRWAPPARCWCGARAEALVTIERLTGPVCLAHVDPETWPDELALAVYAKVRELGLVGRVN